MPRPVLLALALLLLGGCRSPLVVETDPPFALATVNGKDCGLTPVRSEVKSSTFGTYELRIERVGYETVEMTIPKRTHWLRVAAESVFCFPMLFFNIRGPQVVRVALTPATPPPPESRELEASAAARPAETAAAPAADEPARAPKLAQAPKGPEVKKPELPKADAPKLEGPKPPEGPKLEGPKLDAPKVEGPKLAAPKVEAPKVPGLGGSK